MNTRIHHADLAAAMGDQTGDTLVLSNQWARVAVDRRPRGQLTEYRVSGDGYVVAYYFPTLLAAVSDALATLATRQQGRGS